MKFSFLHHKHFVFWSAFIAALVMYITYGFYRGLGWDGDTVVMAGHLQKLLNPDLRNVSDGGTAPKLLLMLLSGGSYLLTGSFFTLTVICVVLNALAIGFLCAWINASGGAWPLLFFFLCQDRLLPSIVLNCDSPAFAIPLTTIGLYLVAGIKRIVPGAIVLLLAALARPGPEVILAALSLFFVVKQKKITRESVILVGAALIAVVHTLFCYKLGYSSHDRFVSEAINNNLIQSRAAYIDHFRYSLNSLRDFMMLIKSNIFMPENFVLLPFFLLGIKICWDRKSSLLSILLLYLLSTSLFAVWFTTGVKMYNAQYLSEIVLIPFIFMPMCITFWQKTESTKINRFLVVLGVIAFTMFHAKQTGILFKGRYEVNPKNGGIWQDAVPAAKKLRELSAHTKDRKFNALIGIDTPFVILDMGSMLRDISYLAAKTFQTDQGDTFFDSASAFRIPILKRPQDFTYSDLILDPKSTDKFDVAYFGCDQIDFINTFRGRGFIPHSLEQCRVLMVNPALK